MVEGGTPPSTSKGPRSVGLLRSTVILSIDTKNEITQLYCYTVNDRMKS